MSRSSTVRNPSANQTAEVPEWQSNMCNLTLCNWNRINLMLSELSDFKIVF
uniref:Uncharacterized protein n=1 Tax=Anguilla anguilla TaxID=7936 RepID=A0A0E9V5B9_ANGAN